MNTFLYLLAERIPGQQEMQRFAHPIHVGIVDAPDFMDAYEQVLENLRPTFADSPQPLEIRFEQMTPPRSSPGHWRRHKPVDMDITFTSDD